MSETRAIEEQKQDSSYDVFQKYFIRKSFNILVLKVSEHLLRNRGYDENTIYCAKNIAYLTLLLVQGSLVTSGTSYGVTELLKYFQYSEDNAYWAGFTTGIIISLALDLTPWGITKTVISTLGGIAGRRSTLWAYEQANVVFGVEEPALEVDDSLEEKYIHQP